MRANSVSQERDTKCVTYQELIAAQTPWATAGVDRSRAAREAQQQQRLIKRRYSPNGLNVSSVLTKHSRHKPGSGVESPIELTAEEKLLGALLEANDALTLVLRMHDDIDRRGIERQQWGVADRKYG